MEIKLTDLEGRSWRDIVRIHRLKEGAEDTLSDFSCTGTNIISNLEGGSFRKPCPLLYACSFAFALLHIATIDTY